MFTGSNKQNFSFDNFSCSIDDIIQDQEFTIVNTMQTETVVYV